MRNVPRAVMPVRFPRRLGRVLAAAQDVHRFGASFPDQGVGVSRPLRTIAVRLVRSR